MAKILISSIGGGQNLEKNKRNTYREADYRFENTKEDKKSSMVSKVIVDEEKIDQVILFGSKKSMWDEVCYIYNLDEKIEYIEIIEDYINEKNDYKEEVLTLASETLTSYLKEKNKSERQSKTYILNYGMNQKEIKENMEIFMKIINEIHDGDEIYIDITHAFRSIPLFTLTVMQFIEKLQNNNVNIKKVYYGMFEASGEYGYTPLVNLEYILEVQKWIEAADEFINLGRGYRIAELLKKESEDYQQLANALIELSTLLSMNYISDIKASLKNISKLLKKVEEKSDTKEQHIFRYVAPSIKQFVEKFNKNQTDSKIQLYLANWYLEHKNYGSEILCLGEVITTLFLDQLNIKINTKESSNEKFNKRKEIKDKIRSYTGGSSLILNAKKLESKINKKRNDVAHAKLTSNKVSKTKMVEFCEEIYKDINSLFKEFQKTGEQERKYIYNELEL